MLFISHLWSYRFRISGNGNFVCILFLECIKWTYGQQQVTEFFFTSVEAVLNALKHQKLTYNVFRYRIWKSTIDLWYAIQKPLFSPITSHNFSWPYVIFELKVIIFEGIPRFLKNLQRVKIKQRFLVYSLRSHTSNTLYKVRNKLKIFTEWWDGIHVHHSKESSASQYNGQTSQMVLQSLCLWQTRC